MSDDIQRSKLEQDSILLELYDLAHRHAKEWIGAQAREDLVQALTLDWLRALRRGTWTMPAEGLDRYVELRVIARRVDGARTRSRDEERDACYLAVVLGTSCDFLMPKFGLDDAGAQRFVRRVRRRLPALWVRAHKMVRVERLTYAEAARALRTSPKCVHNYVTAVQNAFREALPEIGIEAQCSSRGGRRADPDRALDAIDQDDRLTA